MPSDFAFLDHPLDPAHERIDAVDPRLVALGDLAEQGKWQDVGARVDELLAARVYDIRPLSYAFFGAFQVGGLAALATVFGAVSGALGANFTSIGPAKKREHHFDKRLTWLFEKILETIEYHELKRTPEWHEWHQNLAAAAIDRALASGERVATQLAEVASFDESPRVLGTLISWLRSHAELLAAPQRKKTEPPPPISMPHASHTQKKEKTEAPGADLDEAAAEGAAVDALQRTVEVVVSHNFTLLLGKLRAFETLIGKGDYVKAALVAADLQRIIETFDPRDYFPEIFARFGALFSKHVATMTEHLDQRESPTWKALEQFYRVDPKSFVES